MIATVSLALVVALPVAPATAEPVAVTPWRNLNNDKALTWLEQGAAETMVVDLRGAGMRVVERSAIVRALEQVEAAAKANANDDVARAVAAGRIVGAKSLVLGSFQKSGDELRMTARFVDVETGIIADTAKVTGKLDDVFALQDQIVAALVTRSGKPQLEAQSLRQTAKRKQGARAYEKFALSLTASDDDQRHALLREALALDAQLTYARDALTALEQRLRASSDASAGALAERERALLAIVERASEPPDRRRGAAKKLIEELTSARRFRALRAASDRVLSAKVPSDVLDDVDERASHARVLALARLIEIDLALQAGERHLATFSAGAHRADVEKIVRDLVDERRTEPARRKEYDDELRELAADKNADAVQRAFKPCIAAKWSRLPAEMIANCTGFLEKFGSAKDEDTRGHVVSARAYVAWAHAMRGKFDRAWPLLRALEQDVPGALDDSGLRSVAESRWSTD